MEEGKQASGASSVGNPGLWSAAGAVAVTLAAGLGMATATPAIAQDDLTALSDEFNADTLTGWTRFDEVSGWANKIKVLDVGKTTPGSLHLEPYHSAWIRELVGPFVYREVKGDFDVRARLRVRGHQNAIPGGTWSLGGLMARVPNASTSAQWVPRSENWHFITTGVGHRPGEQMTETKGTYNSYSSLKLRPFPTGWVELRIVRVGMVLVTLARPDGEAQWRVRDRFYRMEGNPVMQVGFLAYTTSSAGPVPGGSSDPNAAKPEVSNRTVDTTLPVDMILEADWIRFKRPLAQTPADFYGQVSANQLADPNLSEADLIKALGD